MHLVNHLKKEELLPCCIFVFSKKRCEENADALSTLDFCTAAEKSATHMILEKSLARLKPDDRTLPQIRRMRELLSRGIAVHHGGLLPIVKECVEILFAKTLVKVLFATETFAMGLNLPTRTASTTTRASEILFRASIRRWLVAQVDVVSTRSARSLLSHLALMKHHLPDHCAT